MHCKHFLYDDFKNKTLKSFILIGYEFSLKTKNYKIVYSWISKNIFFQLILFIHISWVY